MEGCRDCTKYEAMIAMQAHKIRVATDLIDLLEARKKATDANGINLYNLCQILFELCIRKISDVSTGADYKEIIKKLEQEINLIADVQHDRDEFNDIMRTSYDK